MKIEKIIENSTINEENHLLNWDGTIIKEGYITKIDYDKVANLILDECIEQILEITTTETDTNYRQGFHDARKLIYLKLHHHFQHIND
jgi:hypothetical protein